MKARTTPKERDIQRAILDFLATVPGVCAWKTGGGMFPMTYKGKTRMVRMGKPGVSDIIGWKKSECACGGTCDYCCDGKPMRAIFLAIEVKRHGSKLTPEQSLFLLDVRMSGGLAIVARSVADVASALGLAPASPVEGVTRRAPRGEG